MVSQHGLSRQIPEEIRLEVRRRCGFGCMQCGNSIVQCEHTEPEFAAALRQLRPRLMPQDR